MPMRPRKPRPDPERWARLMGEVQQSRAQREQGYRAQALKLLPHLCGRCGREFSSKDLKELTVHHKDHNHDNNPADGSNWELLCRACHDDEHQTPEQRAGNRGQAMRAGDERSLRHNPFATLQPEETQDKG